jgi:hypothetical protein
MLVDPDRLPCVRSRGLDREQLEQDWSVFVLVFGLVVGLVLAEQWLRWRDHRRARRTAAVVAAAAAAAAAEQAGPLADPNEVRHAVVSACRTRIR